MVLSFVLFFNSFCNQVNSASCYIILILRVYPTSFDRLVYLVPSESRIDVFVSPGSGTKNIFAQVVDIHSGRVVKRHDERILLIWTFRYCHPHFFGFSPNHLDKMSRLDVHFGIREAVRFYFPVPLRHRSLGDISACSL